MKANSVNFLLIGIKSARNMHIMLGRQVIIQLKL